MNVAAVPWAGTELGAGNSVDVGMDVDGQNDVALSLSGTPPVE